MKIMMRNWRWLSVVLAAGLICATYLLAQTQTTPAGTLAPSDTNTMKVAAPSAAEAADGERLIDAVNADDTQTAMQILHNYGMADDTLLAMAARLGKPITEVELKEPFLKASVGSFTLTDRMLKTNVHANFSSAIASFGYGQPVWMPRRPDTWAIASFDSDILQCPQAPILVLNEKLADPCFIRYFKLYDRYAESLHSVVLNGAKLTNAKLDPTNYDQANRELKALFQLIKARKPDAFVWLSVVKEDSHSDEKWLKAMTFNPDGLQISNLRQFHSPFAETRRRYLAVLGHDIPMMVSGFEGYAAALTQKGDMLDVALRNKDQQAAAAAKAQLGGIGAVVGQDLAQLENSLEVLGYRGLSAHWLLLAAMANSNQATPIDKSNLVDPRAGMLDTYFAKGDYSSVSSLAAEMVFQSEAGSMNWTVGKLYQKIAWLSQSPPRTNDAIHALDDVLAFDFKGKPGRDHYVLGAVKWRIYAAGLSGNSEKQRELAQWAKDQEFRADLKAAFLKQYGNLTQPVSTQK